MDSHNLPHNIKITLVARLLFTQVAQNFAGVNVVYLWSEHVFIFKLRMTLLCKAKERFY
jgi:hypothetical protein